MGRCKLKIFSLCFFLVFRAFSATATNFPERLSDNATISLVTVQYDSKFRSPFSKTCLRIFDTEFSFDQVIDFAHFDDFADDFFPAKFFLNKKKARILAKQFLPFFMEETQNFKANVTETVLRKNRNEVAYIYDFVRTMHTALPHYEYDFDFLTNNAETHISQILHDSERMYGKSGDFGESDDKKTPERSLNIKLTSHSLFYKKLDDSIVLLADFKTQALQIPSLEEFFSPTKLPFVIIFSIISFFFFLTTTYQTIVYFFPRFHRNSFFKSIQILDFLLFFLSGLSGLCIFYLHVFSDQSLFKTDFHFLALNPLHIIAAFYLFTDQKHKRTEVVYWSTTSTLTFLYILILSLALQKLPIVSFLSALPLFLRTVYFYLIAKDIKKERTFLPYALLVKFANWFSS